MTTAPAPGRLPGRPGLPEKLVAAVRQEFRADELAFDPRDPVFGGTPCLVPECGRTSAGHGLCQGTGSGGRRQAGQTSRSSPRRPAPGGGRAPGRPAMGR